MNISFSKPPFLGSMLVFVGVAQKYQYHIGTIFSHTQPVERMLRLYLLWSFYTQVNHPRNFESKKTGSSKNGEDMKLPIFPPVKDGDSWQNPGMGGGNILVRYLSGSTSIHQAEKTGRRQQPWSFNFTHTLLKLCTGDTRKGVVFAGLTPTKGENKRNERFAICPRLSGTVVMRHPRPSTVEAKAKNQKKCIGSKRWKTMPQLA